MAAPNTETGVIQTIELGPTFFGQNVAIKGTTTNDNAAAGDVGEYLSSVATAVSMTANVGLNITSITLTPGDWEVRGLLQTNPAASTTTTLIAAGISSTANTFATLGAGFSNIETSNSSKSAGVGENLIAPATRFSVSSSTPVYLVGNVQFATSTLTASGSITARRMR